MKIHRTRLVQIAILLFASSLLASCAGLVGPRTVELPLDKLQAGIERRFPLNNRVLELFQVELTQPRLALLSDSGRVSLSMDASVAPPFLNQSWRGNMMLSGRLRLDPARNAVVMAEPRVDRFAIDGVDASRLRQLSKIASLLMDQIVTDMPMYTFRPDDLRYAGVQFVPTRISTAPGALVVALEPLR